MAALSAAVIIATAGALAVTTPAQADGCTEMGGVLGFMTSCPNESTPYAAGILCGYGGIPEDKWTMGPWQTYGAWSSAWCAPGLTGISYGTFFQY